MTTTSLYPYLIIIGISILVAAYNEESSIADTLRSIDQQKYPGAFEVLVIDDGSMDATAAIVEANPYPWARLLRQPRRLCPRHPLKVAGPDDGLREPGGESTDCGEAKRDLGDDAEGRPS